MITIQIQFLLTVFMLLTKLILIVTSSISYEIDRVVFKLASECFTHSLTPFVTVDNANIAVTDFLCLLR